MNTTEHYQLNQWEGSDRIMREDFNADNRKTEEALTELADTVAQKIGQAEMNAALQWVKIGEQVLSGTGKKVSVTVENAEQYLYLLILFDVTGGTYTQLQWPGTSNISLLNNSREPLGQCGGIIKALLLPNGGVFIWCAIEGTHGNPYGDEQIWLSDAANSGNITVDILGGDANNQEAEALQPGSCLYIYGLRK